MKKNTFLSLAAACLLPFFAYGQVVSEFIFGYPDVWDTPNKIWETPDGSLNLISEVSINSVPTALLYRVSPQGNVLWQKQLTTYAATLAIEPADDGSFWLGGLDAGGYRLTRYDPEGNVISSFAYSHPDLTDDYYFALKLSPDKQHFVMAFKDQNPPNGLRVVKLTLTGSVVFNKFIASEDPYMGPNFLEILPNGRVIVAVSDFIQGNRLVCFSSNGNQLWVKGITSDFDPEGGVVAVGNNRVALWLADAFTAGEDGVVYTYDDSGNLLWETALSETLPTFNPYQVFADGGNLVLAGQYHIPGELGLGVVKLDADGQVVFTKSFDRLNGNYTYTFMADMTPNGDYIVSGYQWFLVQPGWYQSDKGYCLSLSPAGDINWLMEGNYQTVQNIGTFCKAINGDLWLAGRNNPPGSDQNFDNYLMKISGLEPISPQLLHGSAVLDGNANCLPEPAELPLINFIVKAEANGQARYATTDANGHYFLRLPETSSAGVELLAPNPLWESCQPNYTVNFAAADTALLDVAAKVVAQCPLLSLDGSAPFLRRCFDSNYLFRWCNSGVVDAENITLTVLLDPFTDFVASSIPPASQNGQELVFQLGNLEPGGCAQLSLTVNVSCDAELGQTHCMSAQITADNVCPAFNAGQDNARDCQPNIGSFDPNDIRAFVNDTLREGAILPNLDIEYQIRFQNTGTDTAFNIVIVDTLPPVLDPGSLRPGVSSHPYDWELTGERLLKFRFNNILLPDSTINAEASQGFVQFHISQKTSLPDGTKIDNQARIFFDYNEPVATNIHYLIIGEPLGTDHSLGLVSNLHAFPNPTNGQFLLEFDLLQATSLLIEALDPLGRCLVTVSENGFFQKGKHQLKVDASQWPPGIYFLHCQIEGHSVFKKIMKN
jgi:hypothetical protein